MEAHEEPATPRGIDIANPKKSHIVIAQPSLITSFVPIFEVYCLLQFFCSSPISFAPAAICAIMFIVRRDGAKSSYRNKETLSIFFLSRA